ncbi:MAG: CBS domain-containing protein [Oscillospiraceae bacterium]|jgi:acetoin utilization protein AcuB|nr:CBS domain-containing protein [Oscillospiraceae bacterium]
MFVKARMTPNPVTVTPDVSVSEAFSIMKERQFRRIPVVQGGKLIGIVTEKELQQVSPSKATSLSVFELNYLLEKTTIKDAMSKDPITVQDDDLIEKAALLMRTNKVGALPVMHGDKLVGIITESDIFDAFIDTMGFRNPGVRLDLCLRDPGGDIPAVTQVISQAGGKISHLTMYGDGELVVRISEERSEAVIKALTDVGFLK